MIACLASSAVAAAAEKPARPQILVHYMPWFVAKPVSPAWGWHWTMNVFDPEKVMNGKPQLASHYSPLIGPYDSGDPNVIEYHLLLIKLAGFDGVIVDWYGLTDLYDYAIVHRNTSALIGAAGKLGLSFGICYEDQTVSKLIAERKLAEGDRVKHVRDELNWLRKNWFAEPSYLRFNGRPVLLSFGYSGLSDQEWEQALPKGPEAIVYLSEQKRRPCASGAFDWPVPKVGRAKVEEFLAESKAWPVRMPAAYPRFHDIYAEAKVPGAHEVIDDDAGRTMTWTLERALASEAPFVQVVTWNDWGEGTQVEPSVEFGYRDLEAVQRLRRELVEPAFAFSSDDLRLAHRVYSLRRKQVSRVKVDEAVRLVGSGRLTEARRMLGRLDEAKKSR